MTPARVRRTRAKTLFADLRAHAVEPLVEQARGSGWPLTKWERDPVGFARRELGMFLMPQQVKILESIRDTPKTATRSGQKTGKSKSIVASALWWYGCIPDGRVIMTANTKEQVRNVLWRELRQTIRSAPSRIPGKWSDNPSTGFKAEDGREIIAVTTREIESLGGISGGCQLVLADEASALTDAKAEALDGNLAGAGFQRMAWFCNPTRSEGPMFEAFHARADYWSGLHLNSEDIAAWHESARAEIAAWQAARGMKVTGFLPGVVTASTIARWREEYGVASPFYRVRVLGEFLLNEGGKVISLHTIHTAQEAWPDADEEGPLWIGLDPAGPGDGGDETAFAIGRGMKALALVAFAGLTEDAIIEHLLAFLKTYRRGDEVPQVNVDSEGPIGSRLYYRLRGIAEATKDVTKRFTVAGVRASLPARREPMNYERTRDELLANLGRWMNEGGAIPKDYKLEVELHAADWVGKLSGKNRATYKDEIRRKIGRSPDRRDALALGVWRVVDVDALVADQVRSTREPRDAQDAAFMYDQQRGNEIWWPTG